ncbi:hypothetical protein niasHT_026807 [Heterodera trifolii]|uniref:Uncharacterized protein n=1 Tax=Heterodera trifolii TaxID=157864 RepID=A0ABD2KLF9_9BILA
MKCQSHSFRNNACGLTNCYSNRPKRSFRPTIGSSTVISFQSHSSAPYLGPALRPNGWPNFRWGCTPSDGSLNWHNVHADNSAAAACHPNSGQPIQPNQRGASPPLPTSTCWPNGRFYIFNETRNCNPRPTVPTDTNVGIFHRANNGPHRHRDSKCHSMKCTKQMLRLFTIGPILFTRLLMHAPQRAPPTKHSASGQIPSNPVHNHQIGNECHWNRRHLFRVFC